MTKKSNFTGVLTCVLLMSLFGNIFTVVMWINERSYALEQIGLKGGTIGALRARYDHSLGHSRLFRPEKDYPGLDASHGPYEANTGTLDDGLEIWALVRHPGDQYVEANSTAFISNYNFEMRRIAEEVRATP